MDFVFVKIPLHLLTSFHSISFHVPQKGYSKELWRRGTCLTWVIMLEVGPLVLHFFVILGGHHDRVIERVLEDCVPEVALFFRFFEINAAIAILVKNAENLQQIYSNVINLKLIYIKYI